jgi:hypothetical protein
LRSLNVRAKSLLISPFLFLGGKEFPGFRVYISTFHFRQDLPCFGVHDSADGSRVKLAGSGVDNAFFLGSSCRRLGSGRRG